MIRRWLLIAAFVIGVAALLVFAVSYVVPCSVTFGSLNDLPMSTLNCTSGQLSYGRVYLLAEVPKRQFSYRYYFSHGYLKKLGWMRFALPRADVVDRGIAFSGTGIPHDMFPGEFTRPASPIELQNACFLCVDVPMWFFPVAFLPVPTLAFVFGPYRRCRRRKRGLCVRCGYNLTGNVSNICPECGTPIQSRPGRDVPSVVASAGTSGSPTTASRQRRMEGALAGEPPVAPLRTDAGQGDTTDCGPG